MKPPVRVFTRAAPCTFRHIWNCFHDAEGFRSVQVDDAHAQIGLNVPRGMEQKNRLVRHRGQQDVYTLTPLGEDWLRIGVCNHMRNHPADAGNVKHPPTVGKARRVARQIVRTRPAPVSVKRITRTRSAS